MEKQKESKRDIAAGYNAAKRFQGRRYTGMTIGRSHTWCYDKGTWKETKVSPDEWRISYAVTKRRAGKAPEGSGAPVGTEYRWYILADQNVRKLNANDYETTMRGLKFKIAHKRAAADKWSAGEQAQRRRLIRLLQEMVRRLEAEPIPGRRIARPQRAVARSQGAAP